jgi:hypothetical protein
MNQILIVERTRVSFECNMLENFKNMIEIAVDVCTGGGGGNRKLKNLKCKKSKPHQA